MTTLFPPDPRAELIRRGVLRPREQTLRPLRMSHGPALRLDDAGRAAARAHIRAGQHGARECHAMAFELDRFMRWRARRARAAASGIGDVSA